LLCFEILKNGKQLSLAGLRESGVLVTILTWAGKSRGASARAAESMGPIEGLEFQVGGIDSSGPGPDTEIEWIQSNDIHVGDEILVRVRSAQAADTPAKSSQSVPTARSEGEETFIECSFCGQSRQAGPGRPHVGGIAGPNVFICVRCVVFGERLLDGGLPQLLHLSRTADEPCSFCMTECSGDGFAAPGSNMCRTCLNLGKEAIGIAR
jgi:hypothetical protein